MHAFPPDALTIVRRYRTCELTTLNKDGSPITWPVCARLLDDGRFFMTTSIGMPQKAFNIRRNPKISLLFSEPRGSGVQQPGAVLVQANATADDRIVTDPSGIPELEDYLVEQIFSRQPAGAFWGTWLGRKIIPAYYMRILIYATPTRIRYWKTRDCSVAPQDVEVQHVG